jgi:hypothetical protein
MKDCYLLSLTMLLAAVAGAVADEAPPYYPAPPQVGYQDCVTHCCKLVPETKQIKKTVYEVQEVPYCLKKLPPFFSLFHHHGCDDCAMCAECQCPRYKKVLVKKEIVCREICTSKCVVEEHVEPCQVYQPSCNSR